MLGREQRCADAHIPLGLDAHVRGAGPGMAYSVVLGRDELPSTGQPRIGSGMRHGTGRCTRWVQERKRCGMGGRCEAQPPYRLRSDRGAGAPPAPRRGHRTLRLTLLLAGYRRMSDSARAELDEAGKTDLWPMAVERDHPGGALPGTLLHWRSVGLAHAQLSGRGALRCRLGPCPCRCRAHHRGAAV